MSLRARARSSGHPALVVALAGFLVQGGVEARSWRASGPDGASLGTVATHPADDSVLFAGTTQAGLFRSDDGGNSWRPSNQGIEGEWIDELAAAPADPRILFAGGSGVFRSLDGGASWATVHPARSDDLLLDPADSAVYFSARDQVLKSADGGDTFAVVHRFEDRVTALALDPARPGTLLAAIYGGSIHRSLDGGASWAPLGAGVPALGASQLSFAPDGDGTVLAMIYNLFLGAGLARSTDGGETWATVARFPPGVLSQSVLSLAFDRGEPGTVYLLGDLDGRRGLLRSTDGGETWSPFGDAFSGAALTRAPGDLAPLADGSFAVATSCGVLLSDPGATGWRLAKRGLGGNWILALTADPRRPRALYASTQTCGNFRSADGGRTWTPLGGPERQTSSLAVDPRNGKKLYAGASLDFFASRDRGRSWRRLHVESAGSFRYSFRTRLAIDPAKPRRLFAAYEDTLLRSRNGGRTWGLGRLPDATGGVNAIAVDPRDVSTVYLALGAGGVARSTNGGKTFKKRMRGLPLDSARTLFVDPTDGETLWAGGPWGVYRSRDGAKSWRPADRGIEGLEVRWLLPAPGDPATIYAGTAATGVYRSSDGGDSWQPLGPGLAGVTDLALSGSGPVAGTIRGVFRLVDDGD